MPEPVAESAWVDLHWIPLGAGGHSVRLNGIAYEALAAPWHRRTRCDLYHSALSIDLPHGHYVVEMTPIPRRRDPRCTVVAEGPVGLRLLGRLRTFRYEIRRWRDGIVPDLDHAVGEPVRVTSDAVTAQRVFDLLPATSQLVWGRDERRTGDMWSCNSVTAWALTGAGVDLSQVSLPPRGRAPGWDAGRAVALSAAG